MTLSTPTKIKRVLPHWPSGTAGLLPWLEEMGVSSTLVHRYQKAGWLESLGHGAWKRGGDAVDWIGGLYAVQSQSRLEVHVGGRTALGMQGQAHYLELNQQVVHLFAPRGVNLPVWFRSCDWGVKPKLYRTDFLPPDVGLVDVDSKTFSVKASGSARALMECLYLAPDRFDLVEAYQIMEGLNTLRPTVVQPLLEQCRSVKVKRLFLFMAEQAGHLWVKHLDLTKIKTGAGVRSLADGGVYIPKYQMTVPRELVSA